MKNLKDIQVSYFTNIETTKDPKTESIANLAALIKSDKLKKRVEEIRKLYAEYVAVAATDKKAKKTAKDIWSRAKRALPNVTISGIFSKRHNDCLTKYSGLMQCDIDWSDLEGADRDAAYKTVKTDPHTAVAFKSPSGSIKAWVKVGPNQKGHLGHFAAMEAHYTKLGLKVDENCKDISRACFLSYDPNIYIAKDLETLEMFEPIAIEEPTASVEPLFDKDPYYSIETAEDALKFIKDKLGGNPEYDPWLRLLSGMTNSYGEKGFELMRKIFPEDGEGYEKKRGVLLSDIGVGSVIHSARKAGWDGMAAFSERFFYEGKKGYRFESGQGRYITQNVSDVRRRLKKAGVKPDDIGDKIDHIQESRDICYAGEISGKTAGFYDIDGTRFLVTKSPNFIPARKGKFPTIKAILEGVFSKHETSKNATMQLDSFYGWLQCGVVSLRSGKEQHGQAMALVGGVNCGKTFLQDFIITPCLGGRSAKAALFLQGGTNFNADLFRAEHLILSDEHMSKDMAARNKFAANLKKLTSSTHGEQLHAKGVDGIAITPWWRVSISLNDRPENLLILPPLEDDVQDKIIILRACREKFPMPTNTPSEKELLRAQIEKELPAFLWWLLNDYKIPIKRVCGRFGVDAWHNPEILKIIHKESEECQFLTLIDAHFWSSPDDENFGESSTTQDKWEGEALALKTELCSGRYNVAQQSAARLLGTWANKPGKLLAILERLQDGRISSKTTNGKKIWTIFKPE